MRITAVLVLAAAVLGAGTLTSQRAAWPQLAARPTYIDSLPSAARSPIATTVALAEAEGRVWPRRAEGCAQIASECSYYFADAVSRTCADPRSVATTRSGEMVVGGSDIAKAGAKRVWWIPMHPATGDTLVVRGTLLGSRSDTVRFTMPEWSRGLPDGEFYYLTRFVWPKAGHWLVVATSGADWGCFVL